VIIRSVGVQGFGCFGDLVDVGRLGDGINLLFAPNGSGKSTLVRALTMALVDGHRVRTAELKNWRPWGCGLSPRIAIEFEHGPVVYRLDKGFLEGAYSRLYRSEGGAWRSYMQGDDADEFLRKDVLCCTPPGAGMAKREHWGLAQVLWTSQGDLAMPELADNVVEAVRQSVGSTLTSSGAAIESRIRGLYATFYTTTRGELKKGRNEAPMTALRRRHQELVTAESAAAEALASYDRTAAQIAELRAAHEGARLRVEGLAKEREIAAASVAEYQALVAERDRQTERKRRAEAVYNGLKNRVEAIARAQAEIETLTAESGRLRESLPRLEESRRLSSEKAKAAEASLEAARRVEQDTAKAAAVVQRASEYVRTRSEVENIREKARNAGEIERRIEALARETVELRAPSDAELARARKLLDASRDAESKLAMARVSARIEPLAAAAIRIIEGEKPGEIGLAAGTAVSIEGAPNLGFEIPGFGSIRVTGPAADYEGIRRQLERSRTALGEICAKFGSAELEQLEASRNRRMSLEAEINAQRTALAAVRGKETAEAAAARLSKLMSRAAEIEALHPDWSAQPPDSAMLEREHAAKTESARNARAAAERDWKTSQSASAAAETQYQTALNDLKNNGDSLARVQRELKQWTDDGQTAEQRREALDRALLEWEAARASLEKAEEELSRFPTDPARKAALIDEQLRNASKNTESLHEQMVRAETRIEELAATFPYERLSQLHAELAESGERVGREELRMQAIELLHSVLDTTKKELLESVARPVEQTATELLSEICGRPFAEIRLSQTFSAAGVVPSALPSSGDTVAVDRLSGGEKEQLHLCTRLAIAKELSRAERQLLVLDDVLTFTDAERLTRICDVLQRESSRLQILLLTCHPERFLSIPNVALFDLREAIERASVRSH